MDCREIIMSNDYVDYIWKTDAIEGIKEANKMGLCAQYISSNFAVFYKGREERWSGIPVGDIAVSVCHTQLDIESLETSGILTIQNQPALNLKGNGVIIGFMDSGIALQNSVFQTKDGRTRVIELWDQTDQSGNPPEEMLYGTVYTEDEINEFLREGRRDLPGADENGHGSKIAAIAAGSELEEEDFIGAAPEASIAFVKLKQAKPFMRRQQLIPLDSIAYEEADIMLAIRYLDLLATRKNMPLIICIALGSNTGGHTGSTPLGLYLNNFSKWTGRAVVVAGGNEGNQPHHFYGVVPKDPGYLDVELRVGENTDGFQVNLWGTAPGMFSVEVTSPAGEKVPRIFTRPFVRERYDFLFENTILDIQYELAELISGDERILLAFQNPTPGIWTIRVFAVDDLENSFHIWLPITGFIKDGTYFLRPDPDTTITEPANAQGVITFAGYDARTNSIWQDSSRGFTRTGIQKPDIAAPAVEVSTIDLRGNPSTLSGSSAAAAIGAGACALLMEWGIVQGNVPTMDSVAIQRLLIRGAKRPFSFSYPNRNWGTYGIIVSS